MAQMGNNLLFVPRDASVDGYYSARGVQAEMPYAKAEELCARCPVTSKHATHFVAKFQRRVKLGGGEVILTGFHVIHGGHRPKEPRRRRSFLDDPLEPGHVIAGSEAARLAELRKGDKLTVEGREFTVKYVLPEFGVLDDSRVWARLDEIQELYGKPGVVHGVDALGCMCSGPYFEKIKTETASALPELRMLHRSVVAGTRLKSRKAVEGVGAVVVLIVMILGAVAIVAMMVSEVRERRREIGVLLAMGASGTRIALMFLPKIVLVGALGGLVGWALGTVLAVWAGPAIGGLGPEIKIRVFTGLASRTAVFGAIFALLASLPGLVRAVRMDPVDALREL
jgi:putative ABC transport system permease protein